MRFKLIFDGGKDDSGGVTECTPFYKARLVDADTGEALPYPIRGFRFEGGYIDGKVVEIPVLTLELALSDVEVAVDEEQVVKLAAGGG